MKKYIKSDSDTSDKIKLKFKGTVYEDGYRDSFGHIMFGKNEFEYLPNANPPYVIIHGYKPVGNGYTHTSKKSTAKVDILEE